jgi:hypothetical protein
MASLFEATLTGTYFNQQIISRWNYVAAGDPGTATRSLGLLWALGAVPVDDVYPADTVLNRIALLCSADYHFQQMTVLAVYDPLDFIQVPFTPDYGGEDADSEGMSPVVAYGFRTNQVRRDVRRATKRFPGVIESRVDAGGEIAAAALSALDDLAAAMSATLHYTEDGATLTFTPAVCAKQRYNPTTHLADPAGTAYRYYPESAGGEATQLEHTAQGVTWSKYTQVRSQTSRQYGRGR